MKYIDLGNGYHLHVSPYRFGRVYYTILLDTGKTHSWSGKTIYHVVHTGTAWNTRFAERAAKKWVEAHKRDQERNS